MKPFLDADFLLSNETAKTLFAHVIDLPILDYHCHLSPKEIWENKPFTSVTHLMLGGDHYKWRLMAANGAPERLIWGQGDEREKWRAYADALTYAVGNPLYHWTHLELQRVFGIDTLLGPATADGIFDQTKEMLQDSSFLPRALIRRFRVEVVCTTDDPADSLEYHEKLAQEADLGFTVLPAFRPDRFLYLERAPFLSAVSQLSQAAGVEITGWSSLTEALARRAQYFQAHGCHLSDHSLEQVPYEPCTPMEADVIVRKALSGEIPDERECRAYRTILMQTLAELYARYDWCMQLHLSAMRNNNTVKYKMYGPDTGFDSMDDPAVAKNLSRLMDSMEVKCTLPKTILYSLNPKDNDTLASLIGNFQSPGVPGKIQLGSGWWFNDQKNGMLAQMNALATAGLLGRFVGMLTDSRSFISYPRHEYFRRILCDQLGRWVEAGEFPCDWELLKKLAYGVSYGNAKAYFRF